MPTIAQNIKKMIGTSLVLVSAAILLLFVSGKASALLTFIGGDLNFTATVTQVGASSFSVDKGGTYPFVIVADGNTQYNGGPAQISDLYIGEKVRVSAVEDQGMLRAKSVEPVVADSYGYGTACELFEGSQLWVSAIEQDFLWLSRANITFTVQYNGNTTVMPGNQSVQDLTVGETIAIVGDDCHGDGITANTIVRSNSGPSDPGAMTCESYEGIVVYNSQVLLSHDAGGAFTPNQAVSVPAGTYDVYGVSFDNHTDNAWDTLPAEQWYVEGFNSNNPAYTSGVTDDLPDGVNRNNTNLGSVTLASAVDSLRFVHAAYVDPAYNSILPECVVFMPTSQEQVDTVNEDIEFVINEQ